MKIHKLSDNSEVFDAYSKVINKYNNKFYKKASVPWMVQLFNRVAPELAAPAGKTAKEIMESALSSFTGKTMDDVAIEIFKDAGKSLDDIETFTGKSVADVFQLYKTAGKEEEFIRLAYQRGVTLQEIARITSKDENALKGILRLGSTNIDQATANTLRSQYTSYFTTLFSEGYYNSIVEIERKIAAKMIEFKNKPTDSALETEIKGLIEQHNALNVRYFEHYNSIKVPMKAVASSEI